MENDKMNQAWSYYESMLDRNLKLNEEVLRQMNLDRANKEMRTPRVNIVINTTAMAILIGVFLMWTVKYSGDALLLAGGIVSMVLFCWYLYTGIREWGLLNRIDIYRKPVVELQKALADFERWYAVVKKIDLATFPLLAAAISPVVTMATKGINILDHWKIYLSGIVVAVVAGYFLVMWIYRNVYDKRIRNIKVFLDQIDNLNGE